MKKKAFTISELIVTLGVIGVMAAIISPALSNLIPDKNKALVLNSYNTLQDTTLKLLENEEIYYALPSATLGQNKCLGLGCTYQPFVKPFNSTTYTGENKYQNLLKYYLSQDSSTFKLNNDITCTVTSKAKTNSSGQSILETDIFIELPSGCKDVFSGTCLNPKMYRFSVDTFGNFTAVDALTQAYLETPLKMNNRKEDIKRAKKIKGIK